MKAEDKEKLLADYFLGNLNWEQSERLDELLKSDPKLRLEMMQLQEGFEEDVLKLDSQECPKERLKGQIMHLIGGSDDRQSSTQDSGEESKTNLSSYPVFFKWGVAAVVLLMLTAVPFVKPHFENKGTPILAVFEIGEDQNGFSTPVKEVFYEENGEFPSDSLYMAEVQAEKLWSSYMAQYRLRSEKPNKQGFVVLDLKGQQGFVGIYSELLSQLNKKSNEGLTLSFGDSDHPVSVGVVTPDGDEMEGVFYFSLESDFEEGSDSFPKPKLIKEVYQGI